MITWIKKESFHQKAIRSERTCYVTVCTGVALQQSAMPLFSLTVFRHCSNMLNIMHSVFTVFVLIRAAGSESKKRMRMQLWTHTYAQAQAERRTQSQKQIENTWEHMHIATHTHSYGVWELSRNIYLLVDTPTHTHCKSIRAHASTRLPTLRGIWNEHV